MTSPFKRPTRLESIYREEVDRLIARYFSLPSTLTLGEITNRLVEWGQAESFLEQLPRRLATRMITQVLTTNANNWRQAASQSSKGKYIYSILKNQVTSGVMGDKIDSLIAKNAKLIRTVPNDIAYSLTKFIQEQQVKGLRSEEIVKQIHPQLSYLRHWQVARLARTEVAKADTAITRVRAEAIGLNWYQWQTSEDARVRDSHRKMDLVLINWNDAPSPELLVHQKSEGHYHAGNIYNCRCVALPLLSLDEVSWPAKIFSNGSIKRLTRRQFVLKSGLPLSIAA
jgi:SPP1 gp7 family putative phage head morphogenesis protein